ncbi:MAG: Gfo/Idh/MocA family oxidoreductase [Pirellulaceae bacterium]
MPSPLRPTRFGIIGTGRITRRLVADLQSTDGVSVTAIASRTEERAKWYADQYGIAAAVTGYQALLERDDVDAVYISLPPSLHKEWSIAAANASKTILCEKPLALNTHEALQIQQAAIDNNVRWIDATGWLHHERTAAIAQLLAARQLGKIGHISAAVSFFQPFVSDDHRLDAKLGGGCLLDLAWYAGGLIRFATGSLPQRVFASAMMHNGVSQRVTAMLWFADDVTATLSCGYDTATRKWFEIAGSNASIVCDDFTRPWANKPARCWVHAASGDVQQLAYDGYQEQKLISQLIGDEPLDSYHQQAIDTHRILDALQQSIDAGEAINV